MKLKRITAVVLILAVLTVAFGVWAVSATVKNAKLVNYIALLESGSAQTGTTAVISGYDSDGIAAEFKGGVVTIGEATAKYNEYASYYDILGMDESEYAEGAKQDVLESLAEDKILRLKAEELGLYDVSTEDHAVLAEKVQAEFDAEVEYYMAFRSGAGKDDAQVRQETIDYLAENGITLEGMISAAEQDLWKDKLYDHVTAGAVVSDEEVYAFYEKQVEADEAAYAADYAQYEMDLTFGRVVAWHPEGIRRVDVVNIPFNAEQQNLYNELQAALAGGDSAKLSDVDALYQQLLPTAQAMLGRAQQGEDFAVLDAEAGDNYYPESGAYVSANSSVYSDDFRNAAMSLANVGDISGLVYTDTGIAIIKYAGDVTPGAVSFDDIKEHLKESCAAEVKSSRYNTQVFMWIKEAEVKYYPDRF